MQKFLFLLFWGFSIGQITAQSIAELLQLAEANSLTLKALDETYQAARERGAQISQRPDPTLAIGVFALPIETRLGVQRVRIGAMQSFGNKKARHAKEIALNTLANAEGQNGMIQQLAINFQIKKAYVELYQMIKNQENNRKKIQLLKTMEQLTSSKVESGKGSAVDVLKVTLKIQELTKKLAILAQETQKPVSRINQLLNRPLNTPIDVVDTLIFAMIPYKMEEIEDAIQYEHPLMRRYSFEKETAKQNLRVNELDQKPTFSVGIDYIIMDKLDNFEFARNGRDVIMPKVNVNIPLYKTKYGAKQREEEWKIKALDTEQEDAKRQFLVTIHQTYLDYEAIRLKIDLYNEQIQTTKSIINVLETQYSAKGKGFEELLKRQISLLDFDLLLVEEIVKSHIAKAIIERYLPYQQ